MKIIRNLALAAAAGAMVLGVAGTTAASAGTGPVAQATAGNTPAVSLHVRGPTYLEEHASGRTAWAVYMPSKWYLLGSGSTGVRIYTTSIYWYSWGKNNAAGEGYMWGVRYGHKVYVGHVTMKFWQRRTDAVWTTGPHRGQRLAFFGKVRISGILPGNGGSVQYWRWSWRADNWVYSG